jgi:hypothetical protein
MCGLLLSIQPLGKVEVHVLPLKSLVFSKKIEHIAISGMSADDLKEEN